MRLPFYKILFYSSYVALVYPCSEKICIPKCCERGFYFNTVNNNCTQESEENIPKFETQLYDTTQELSNEIHDYYIIHREPQCQMKKLLNNDTDVRPLFVQSSGQLQIQMKKIHQYDYFENHRWVVSNVTVFCFAYFSFGLFYKRNVTQKFF